LRCCWALKLRTGLLVVRVTVWVPPSLKPMVMVVVVTCTVTICPAQVRPREIFCPATTITPVALAKPPKGQRGGRPSKSLTLEQALALMEAAKGTRLEAYITLSLLTGLRTEEARALRWDHVVAWAGGQWQPVTEAGFDHEQLAVLVWRSDRAGGDTKTPRSRRTLALARGCVAALRDHRARQAADRLAAGLLWQDHNLVFASTVGTPLDDHNVRRQVRKITESAGLGTTWVPRELRPTFVSLLCAHGVPVEAIALLAGHNQTATTELVYRHQIVPVLTRGAEVMDQIFG